MNIELIRTTTTAKALTRIKVDTTAADIATAELSFEPSAEQTVSHASPVSSATPLPLSGVIASANERAARALQLAAQTRAEVERRTAETLRARAHFD